MRSVAVPAPRERIDEDVCWLRNAVPLMTETYWHQRGYDRVEPHWAHEVMPRHLPTVQEVPRAVGRYFEWLHMHSLGSVSTLIEVQRVLRVSGATTLGELDSLYRDRNGRLVHREIAIKYYLGSLTPSSAPRDWIGPRRRDRLDLKLDRLVNHQLTLPIRAFKREAWPKELPFPDVHEVLLLGALFPHFLSERLPDDVEPSVETGFWCESQDWFELSRARAWAVIPKPWWLSPTQYKFERERAAADVVSMVEQMQQPVMVGSMGGRGFVVPNGWE